MRGGPSSICVDETCPCHQSKTPPQGYTPAPQLDISCQASQALVSAIEDLEPQAPQGEEWRERFHARFRWLYDHALTDPENVKADLDYETLEEWIALERLQAKREALEAYKTSIDLHSMELKRSWAHGKAEGAREAVERLYGILGVTSVAHGKGKSDEYIAGAHDQFQEDERRIREFREDRLKDK